MSYQSVLSERNKILEALHTLKPDQRLAFAASCCERLLPSYRAFVIVHHWGNWDIFRQALDSIWLILKEKVDAQEQFKRLLDLSEQAVPDSDDFGSAYVQPAISASAAICSVLKACLANESTPLDMITDSVIVAIESYLYAVNFPYTEYVSSNLYTAFDEWLYKAPLLWTELQKQAKDIVTLQSEVALNPQFIESFRQSATKIGVDPLRSGLVISPT